MSSLLWSAVGSEGWNKAIWAQVFIRHENMEWGSHFVAWAGLQCATILLPNPPRMRSTIPSFLMFSTLWKILISSSINLLFQIMVIYVFYFSWFISSQITFSLIFLFLSSEIGSHYIAHVVLDLMWSYLSLSNSFLLGWYWEYSKPAPCISKSFELHSQ